MPPLLFEGEAGDIDKASPAHRRGGRQQPDGEVLFSLQKLYAVTERFVLAFFTSFAIISLTVIITVDGLLPPEMG